jgi:demethylmenaquinone methyltransferase/2-methoxy-6-polyprenyl-1,4-benzoquinol methylase
MPAVGFLLTGNYRAYRYLSRTVHAFPYGERFLRILRQTGFVNVRPIELASGATTIYVAEKQT